MVTKGQFESSSLSVAEEQVLYLMDAHPSYLFDIKNSDHLRMLQAWVCSPDESEPPLSVGKGVKVMSLRSIEMAVKMLYHKGLIGSITKYACTCYCSRSEIVSLSEVLDKARELAGMDIKLRNGEISDGQFEEESQRLRAEFEVLYERFKSNPA